MGIKQLYNDNLRKLPTEYGDVSVMVEPSLRRSWHSRDRGLIRLIIVLKTNYFVILCVFCTA